MFKLKPKTYENLDSFFDKTQLIGKRQTSAY